MIFYVRSFWWITLKKIKDPLIVFLPSKSSFPFVTSSVLSLFLGAFLSVVSLFIFVIKVHTHCTPVPEVYDTDIGGGKISLWPFDYTWIFLCSSNHFLDPLYNRLLDVVQVQVYSSLRHISDIGGRSGSLPSFNLNLKTETSFLNFDFSLILFHLI